MDTVIMRCVLFINVLFLVCVIPVLNSRRIMPIKWVLHWQPNAGSTVNNQILNEVSQCVESMNGVKDGRWKSTLTFYKPNFRDSSILTIMEKLQSYKSRVALHFEGVQYQIGDFQMRVGKVVPTHSENLRGIVMEKP